MAQTTLTCIACNRFISDTQNPPTKCPTCGVDNTTWAGLSQDQRFTLFPLWVWLPAVLIITVGGWAKVPLSAAGAAFAFILLGYLSRMQLRHYELTRRATPRNKRPGLATWAIIAIVAGIVVPLLAKAGIELLTGSEQVAPVPMRVWEIISNAWRFTALPSAALGITLFAVLGFVHAMDERFPSPIFMDDVGLTRIVLKTITDVYLYQTSPSVPNEGLGLVPLELQVKPTVDVERVSRNSRGGLDLLVRHHHGKTKRDPATGEYVVEPTLARYDVATDEWGNILNFRPAQQPRQAGKS